jgi:hypothetical protein
MKKLFTTILLLSAGLSLANAAPINVTNNQDAGSGSFRSAVSLAKDGDQIVFDAAFTIFLETPIQLGDKTLSIDGLVDGTQVILDGNYLDADNDTIDDDGLYTRIFTIIGTAGKEVNLSNLVIQNGSTYSKELDPLSEISTMQSGGGMYIDLSEGGVLTVRSCTIHNNILAWRLEDYHGGYQTTLHGAGVYSVYGGDFVDCIIKNNTLIAKNAYSCNMGGGGAFILEGASFRNTLVAGNRIIFEPINNDNFFNGIGAGLSLVKSEMTNCVIVGNTIKNVSNELKGYFSNAMAAGIYSVDGSVYNTTIVKNGIYNIPGQDDLDQVYGGGALLSYAEVGEAASADYQNNILYGNYSSSNIFHDGVSSSNHTKYTGISDAADMAILDLDETSILLESNPFKQLPFEGEDGQWGTGDDFYGDLRLKKNAACIDAGNPDDTQFNALAMDFYGRARIHNNRIDIGALEFYESDVTYSLSGKVHTGSSGLAAGRVEVYDVNDTSQPVAAVDVNSDGSFEFLSLIPGSYYYYAIPDNDSEFYATWFGNETNRANAIAILVDDIIYDVDIHLVSKSTTGTGEVSVVELKVYPNPATDLIHFSSNLTIREIIMYDSFGSPVKHLDGTKRQLVVSDLGPGFYVVSIITDQKIFNRQLIIK